MSVSSSSPCPLPPTHCVRSDQSEELSPQPCTAQLPWQRDRLFVLEMGDFEKDQTQGRHFCPTCPSRRRDGQCSRSGRSSNLAVFDHRQPCGTQCHSTSRLTKLCARILEPKTCAPTCAKTCVSFIRKHVCTWGLIVVPHRKASRVSEALSLLVRRLWPSTRCRPNEAH